MSFIHPANWQLGEPFGRFDPMYRPRSVKRGSTQSTGLARPLSSYFDDDNGRISRTNDLPARFILAMEIYSLNIKRMEAERRMHASKAAAAMDLTGAQSELNILIFNDKASPNGVFSSMKENDTFRGSGLMP